MKIDYDQIKPATTPLHEVSAGTVISFPGCEQRLFVKTKEYKMTGNEVGVVNLEFGEFFFTAYDSDVYTYPNAVLKTGKPKQ